MMKKKCYKCKKEKEYTEFHKDKSKKDGYNSRCIDCSRIFNREYVKDYDMKGYLKKWREDNRVSVNIKKKNKLDKNPLLRISANLRSSIYNSFKRNRWREGSDSEKLLGASFDEARSHIESTFKEGMSWDNYGKWHIDHIVPLNSANNEKELVLLCNHKNLQSLWALENLKKGHKIINAQ